MDGQEDQEQGKGISLRDASRKAWDSSYSFLQPKLRKLIRPTVYAGLGAAAFLGAQNRHAVKGAVHPETPTVKAILTKEPVVLDQKIVPIDDNTSEWLPEVTEANILLCDKAADNGSVCQERTVYYTKEDVSGKRIRLEGNTLTVEEPLLEANQTRPWARISKER